MSLLTKTTAFIFVAAIFSACKPGTIDLNFHPQPGQYRVVFVSDGEVGVNVAGTDANTSVQSVISSVLDINAASANSYRFNLSYSDFQMSQQANGMNFSLNNVAQTETTFNGEKLRHFLQNVSFEGSVNNYGKADSVQASDSLKTQLEQLTNTLPALEKTKVLTAITPLLSSDMARGMIDQCFFVFPKKKVNIGESWTNEIVMQNVFSMVIKSEFTLLEIKDSIATLKVESNISPAKNEVIMPGMAMNSPRGSDGQSAAPGLDIMGMKLHASFEGTQTGNIWINMKKGIIERNRLVQDVKGKISISIIDLPMTMKMKTGYNIEAM